MQGAIGPAVLAALLVLVVVALARPVSAWWADDAGNRELLAGHDAHALTWFDSGLRLEPQWGLLHEDRGRALLVTAPREALAEFKRAACGSPCIAEEGDALAAMGRVSDAVDRYILADAVGRASDIALALAARGNIEQALGIERGMIGHLHDGFVERAELASAYATVGEIEASAADMREARKNSRDHGRRAVAAFEKASSLAPLNEGYLLSLGFAELRWGSSAAARAAFEKLLAIHPQQPDAQAALARMDRDANAKQ